MVLSNFPFAGTSDWNPTKDPINATRLMRESGYLCSIFQNSVRERHLYYIYILGSWYSGQTVIMINFFCYDDWLNSKWGFHRAANRNFGFKNVFLTITNQQTIKLFCFDYSITCQYPGTTKYTCHNVQSKTCSLILHPRSWFDFRQLLLELLCSVEILQSHKRPGQIAHFLPKMPEGWLELM